MEKLKTIDFAFIFSYMERKGKAEFEAMDKESVTYEYLGEIDCPEDMRGIAPDDVVNSCHGKYNWFLSSDGRYFWCDDYQAEAIFDSGKCAPMCCYDDCDEEDYIVENTKIFTAKNINGENGCYVATGNHDYLLSYTDAFEHIDCVCKIINVADEHSAKDYLQYCYCGYADNISVIG